MIIAKAGKFILKNKTNTSTHKNTTHELYIVMEKYSVVIAHFENENIVSHRTKILDYIDNIEDIEDLKVLMDIASLILTTEEVQNGE